MADEQFEDVEQQMAEMRLRRKQIQEAKKSQTSSEVASQTYQQHIDHEVYDMSIAANGQVEDEDIYYEAKTGHLSTYTADSSIYKELEEAGKDDDPLEPYRRKKIVDRENEYQARRHNRKLSPSRADPFADGGKTPHPSSQNNKPGDFSQSMMETQLKNQELELKKEILNKLTNEEKTAPTASAKTEKSAANQGTSTRQRRRLGWDAKPEDLKQHGMSTKPDSESISDTKPESVETSKQSTLPSSEKVESADTFFDKSSSTLFEEARNFQYYDVSETPSRMQETDKIDSTPVRETNATPSRSSRSSRWNQIPGVDATPRISTPAAATPSATASRLQATPLVSTSVGMSTRLDPLAAGKTPSSMRAYGMATPSTHQLSKMAPDEIQALRAELDLGERNKPWTDEDLSRMFPFDGYKVIAPPADYNPIRANAAAASRVTSAPSPDHEEKIARKAIIDGYTVPSSNSRMSRSINIHPDDELPTVKTEDLQYFGKLLNDVDEDALPLEEKKERMVMKLLLKIKNGTPPMRKSGLRQITEKAREFGAGPLFNQILPILMSPSLEDQERHLLVKVIDRILYKLDDLVRPYVHKILVVIEPLLIDEDYFARVEGREIISNLAKAAGLATMISTMRPDIDDSDEYVRNTTARAFSVVASALGIPSLLPFLRAVCKSKKSWQARHTGIKIVHQISVLMGCAVLPHLRALVEIIEHGLVDEQQKVRTMTALAIAGLAEASTPYGIESFDSVLKPLWKGIRQHRGKGLAAFLKAIGFLIPLMDAEYALHYTKEVIVILVREFTTPDEEMRKIVLKVVKQCVSTDGIESSFIRSEILPEFFKRFWNHRMAVDKKSSRQLIETTLEISNKVGCPYMLNRLVDGLKDDSEPYRKMVMEAVDAIIVAHSATGIDTKLEEQLIDGALYAFQEQFSDDTVVLDGFGTIVNSLGLRTKPYIPQICGIILWRLNNKSPKIRQYAAEMVIRLTPVMKICEEETLISHLSMVLFEYLGEEYPDVLGSILGALKAIVNVIGMNRMNPPIKDLLPRLTPILKNRNEKVEENCIELVGRIADRGSEHVSAREWMRISFDLLELLSAHRKSIRRAAVNTFGYIAKAIGPQDVIAVLLNNLKVQERQNRVCTTVAIAIVAETCSPFTILPALMNEYRVPEVNVQNGVLKALAFMFEYIGEMSKDYIYSVTPLFEDALTDRDLVHRQIASAAIKHMSVGVFGFGKEDALTHLMNNVWPNILEHSPHVINAVMEAIEGFRLSVGPCRVLQYLLHGLFHPARKVRDIYWKVFNTMYIAAQDALVAFYPAFPNEPSNHYQRDELLYML